MKSVRTSLLGCTAILAFAVFPAHAAVDQYSVEGNSSVRINLEVCSAESQLAVQGDAGTDLDFIVTDPSGNPVHTDQGIDDYLSVVLDKGRDGCATYGLAVSNLGEEENAFTVVLEPITESSTRVEKYIIQGSETRKVNFKACGTSAELIARGDGDTDLDFIVRNADGAVVHENVDTTDETTATLAGLLSDCETFEMEVSNLGEVYNALMVMVAPKGASAAPFAGTAPSTSLASAGNSGIRNSSFAETEGAGEYRADANSAITVKLPVCGVTRLEVRGDGDTDLDFTVTDSSGNTVHSDFDLSDVTFTTLTPSSQCETFEMEVSNLGDVYNVFTVALIDSNAQGGGSGAGEYRVNANAETKLSLRACRLTNVFARGDGDTDLDFDVTDASDNSVHSDYDMSDQTQFTLDPGSGCADYQMTVRNLGDVYNLLTVTTDNGPDIAALPSSVGSNASAPVVGSGVGEYRADANASVRVELPICELTFISVEGDGDTDLDFQIFSRSGSVVHSDYDLTDVTYTTLTPGSSRCETFILDVENLGDVYNVFKVSYGPGAESAVEAAADLPSNGSATSTVVSVPNDTASTDGQNRNIAILNQTGETLNFIYWSNSATLAWGEDKLGENYTLSRGQQWNVNVNDGSNACLFDFRAVTVSAREIEVTRVNVCEVTSVTFE